MNIRYPIYEGVYRILTPDINAGENEIEKNAAWAGQARVCRGKHERDSPYPLHA